MKKIHIICKTHLDLGFTDYAENIEKIYREKFIHDAIAIAEELNKEHKMFIWTLGSWMIENALNHSSDKNRVLLSDALRKGYVKPHGLPFTTHTELLDEDAMRYGLNIAKKLGQEFGFKVTAAKMTDVPGHTKALIPLLSEFGIKMLHIGVNEGSAMPDTPQAFVWKVEGKEVVVVYEGSYGSLYKNEHIDDILCFAHSSDNHGPNSRTNIIRLFNRLRREYPDYIIEASTLDEYAEKLWEAKDKLPIITSEIGDSWIHGSASDPYKSAGLRELINLKNKWINDKSLTIDSEEYKHLNNYILQLAEHTCGMDVKRHLSDVGIFLKKDFIRARAKDKVRINYLSPAGFAYKMQTLFLRLSGVYKKGYYSAVERSWQEQREYLDKAVNGLSSKHKREAFSTLASLRPLSGFNITGMQEIESNTLIEIPNYKVVINDKGAIGQLTAFGTPLIKDNNNALITYNSYGAKDYDFWLNNYSRNLEKTKGWVIGDFARPLLNYFQGEYPEGSFPYKAGRIFYNDNVIVVRLNIRNILSEELGAPREMEIKYIFNKQVAGVITEVIWMGKDASRLSESIFLHYNMLIDKNSLKYIKLNREINPYDVVRNGNRNLSAVQEIQAIINNKQFKLINHHAPLVALGKGKILKFDNEYEDVSVEGLSFNLYNNVWGTNFPLWYSDNAYFKFELIEVK